VQVNTSSKWYTYIYDLLNKFTHRNTVKCRKTAVCSRHRTVVRLDFGSTALLRYGQYPYRAVFCTAVAVYGTVESPSQSLLPVNKIRQPQSLTDTFARYGIFRYVVRTSSRCTLYTGDIYKQGTSSHYQGSVDDAILVSRLLYLALRVYLPLTISLACLWTVFIISCRTI
jgi:hypothetical protein